MPEIITIDLHFRGEPAAIAVYAIEGREGYTLVDCGPFSCHDQLVAGLEAFGIRPEQISAVLLTHIHFDHAGAAWWWARRGARVYVHPNGFKHMLDPTRLYASAARIYGADRMEELWGKMDKIDEYDIAQVMDKTRMTIGGHLWVAHHTPGHASHHIAWQLDKTVFTGDVAGIKIKGGPAVPPLPPPDINISHWHSSLDRLRSLRATTFYPTHYGACDAQGNHLEELRERLDAYVDYVRKAMTAGQKQEEIVPGFSDFVTEDLRKHGVDEKTIAAYQVANPPGMSVTGIMRWLSIYEA